MVFNLKWLLLFCSSLVGIGICGALGLLHKLWETDATMISFSILVLYLIVSPFVGWLTAYAPARLVETYRAACRFVPEFMTGLGMLGTVIGFLMMLGPTFGGLDAGNVKAMQTALGHMAGGMAVALTTTLVGLACSMVLQLQLVNLDLARA
jgi:hypothetical protein